MSSLALRIVGGLLLVFSAGLWAAAGSFDDPEEATSLLAKGKRLLREGDWFQASKVFEELAGRYPDSKDIDKYIFYRAKAKYYSREYDAAIAGFTYFLARFSTSKELSYVNFFLGNVYYRGNNVDKAVTHYLQAYRLADDTRLTDIIVPSLQTAFKNATSISLGRADFEPFPMPKRCTLVNLLADVLLRRGELIEAERIRTYCDKDDHVTGSPNLNRKHPKDHLEIAMVLPFSGELHSFGEDIYDGAVVAADLYRSETERNFKLTPYDTKGDPIDAARIIKELSQSDAHAAIGPLTSEEAAVVSASLSCGTLPLLVPAATKAGLTLLSNTSFQLSPNIELQGVRMAEYAVEHLKADSTVIITSTDTDHLRLSRAFSERFQQLGGMVIAIEYYRPRDKDFGPYIKDVKAIMLGKHPDSIFFVNEEGDTLDPDGLEASVDCLFLPGTPNQLRLLLQQINFYNLNGAYLGTDAWGDEAVLKLGDNITKGAVFPSPFLTDETGDEYLRFAAAYDARFGRQPNRLSRVGYDAVTLMTRAINSGAGTREKLTEALKKVEKYEGASGRITFGKNRENIEMPLFRIVSKQAVPLTPSEDFPDSSRSGSESGSDG